MHGSEMSHTIRNPTRFGEEGGGGLGREIRRSRVPWARGSMLELWHWQPENRGLRDEKEETGKNSTTSVVTKIALEQDEDSQDVRTAWVRDRGAEGDQTEQP